MSVSIPARPATQALWLAPLLIIASTGCGGDRAVEPEQAAGDTSNRRPVVRTVNYPLAWLAQQIGGDDVLVLYDIPADVDPAYWRPGPEAIAAYLAATGLQRNGDAWESYVSDPDRTDESGLLTYVYYPIRQ